MKRLLLDIETAPNIVHVWGLWQQNVGLNQILASGYVMCWAAKWYQDDKVYFDSVHRSKPREMLERIHAMVDDADVVIHYNGKSFDMPTLNKEFISHKMLPPSPYKQIDLCEIAKREFRFPSNRLEYIAKALGLGEKVKHEGHELWVKCMNNDPEAWARMREYNVGDVTLLEQVYDRILPWIKSHPSHGLYSENGHVCPSCGGSNVQRRGYARTQASKFTRYQCNDCGSWSRGAKHELPLPIRREILRGEPR